MKDIIIVENSDIMSMARIAHSLIQPLRVLSQVVSTTILLVAIVSFGDPTLHTAAQTVREFQPNVRWGGRAVAVTVHPSDAAIATAASESGGLFKTTDGGDTWMHIDTLQPFRMSDVKYAPGDAQIVIATAWGDSRTINGGGIWRSTDGGRTWRKPETANPPALRGCSPRANAWGIAFESGSNFVYVGTDCGLAISRDLGATWEHSVSRVGNISTPVWSVVAPSANSGIVDVCGLAGFQRSITRGLEVFRHPTGICAWGTRTNAASPLNGNVVFATTGGNALFESDDGGLTWTNLNPPLPPRVNRSPWVATHLSADGNPDHFDLYFGNGIDTFRQNCTNRSGPGLHCSPRWMRVNTDHTDSSDLAFGPSGNCPLYMASDGGVQKTTDCGANWTVTGGGSGGYNALQVYDMNGQIITDDVHTDLYFGTQDNYVWASSDNGTTWPNPIGGEGFHLQMEQRARSHEGQIITGVVCAPCLNFKAMSHFSRGSAWNNPPGGRGNPFIIERNTYIQFSQFSPPDNTLYLTTDAGGGWTPVATISETLQGTPQVSGPPSNPTVYEAIRKPGGLSGGEEIVGLVKIEGVRGTALVSPADGGLTSLGKYSTGQGTFVFPVVFGVDPFDPDHLIAADVGTGEMKQTFNGGYSWHVNRQLTDLVTGDGTFRFNVSPNEELFRYSPGVSLQAHAIGFNPGFRYQILVGTEASGIIQSDDGGLSWDRIPGSERITAISSFFFDRDGSVIVSTYGRGLWKLIIERPRLRVPDFLIDICWPGPCVIDPDSGATLPISRLGNPDFCPICRLAFIRGGAIRDAVLDKNGFVRGVLIDGGQMRAFSLDGKEVSLDLPVQSASGVRCVRSSGKGKKPPERPVPVEVKGEFKNCRGCKEVVKKGGIIRGLMMENGRVRALIADFTPTRQSDQNAVTSSAVTAPPMTVNSSRNAPYIQLVGAIPITGQTAAFTGDTVTVYGRNFCSGANCSPVSISIGDRILAEDVKVSPNGDFQLSFVVTEPPGHYVVRTLQTSGNTKLIDAELLNVPVRDLKEQLSNQVIK
jgi:hypothetical protein